MIITEGIIRQMPSTTLSVISSPINKQPRATAVRGSSAPSTAVIVEPIRWTAITRQRFVTTVHTMPSKSRWLALQTAEKLNPMLRKVFAALPDGEDEEAEDE